MSLARYLMLAIAMATVAAIILPSAKAETSLSDFNGEWRGNGTDRNSPIEPAQATQCHMKIRADLRRLDSETTCIGEAGLRKLLRLAVKIDGDQLTGEAGQTSTVPDGAAQVFNGTVTGRKTDTTADLDVRFPGFTPSATIALRRLDPSRFSMTIASLGLTLTDVTFERANGR